MSKKFDEFLKTSGNEILKYYNVLRKYTLLYIDKSN